MADEVHQRLVAGNFSRRFACFTFDDGYRDNRDFALSVMREFEAPFTVYVASDFAQGTGRLWWVALEMAVASIAEVFGPTTVGKLDRPVDLAWCSTQATSFAVASSAGKLPSRVRDASQVSAVRDICSKSSMLYLD